MSKSDAILTARARDFASEAEKREYEFILSRFLSPSEQAVFSAELWREDPSVAARSFFYGGASGADRRICIAVPSFVDVDGITRDVFSPERETSFVTAVSEALPGETFGIVPLRIRGGGFVKLSHRDYMGSILALGIEREVVGDIAVTDDYSAIVFVSEVIAPYITTSLERAGRDKIRVSVADVPPDFVIPRKFQSMQLVAASPRADAVVAALTNASRAEAKDMCLGGLVDVNHVSCTATDKTVSPGDIVSVRGYGKFIIDSFNGETRSGRARLSVRKYL